MTRRDFQLIAGVLADCERTAGEDRAASAIVHYAAERFARELAGTNERFDGGRFMRAAVPILMGKIDTAAAPIVARSRAPVK